MKQYNMVIIGLGGMGNWHRELLGGKHIDDKGALIPGVDQAGIENLNVRGSFDLRQVRQDLAVQAGIIAYPSLQAVLDDPEVDLILCATPNEAHKDIAIKAMQAGKHVVCEKPVCLNSVELAEMMAVSEQTGKLFVVHQNRRWDEDFLSVKKMVDEKLLGDVFRIESRVHGSRGIPNDWRQEPQHGGGMVFDWGVHILDQALMMIDQKIKSVYATVDHVTNELVDDGFHVELTFESGLSYMLEVGTSNFIDLPRWYVLGRDGSAVIRDWAMNGEMVRVTDWSKNDAVPIRTAAGLTKTMAPRTEDTIKTEALPIVKSDIRDFYNNVVATMDGREEIIVKLPQVMRVMKLMEAILASAENQQVVPFEV